MTDGASAAPGDVTQAGNGRADGALPARGNRPPGGDGREFDRPRIERAVREILIAIGEDP